MDRRRFLVGCCVGVSVPAAGCSNAPAAGTEGERTTDGTVTSGTREMSPSSFDAAEDVAIVVSNSKAAPVTATLTVTHDGERVFERRFEIDSDGRRTLDPGIDELGDHELIVSLCDGTEHVRPFTIEPYDRRMGSNLIVEIDDDIVVLLEE